MIRPPPRTLSQAMVKLYCRKKFLQTHTKNCKHCRK